MTLQQLEVEHPSMDWIDRYRNLAELGNRLKAECPELPVMALSTVNPRHPLPADQMSLLDESPRRFSPLLLGACAVGSE